MGAVVVLNGICLFSVVWFLIFAEDFCPPRQDLSCEWNRLRLTLILVLPWLFGVLGWLAKLIFQREPCGLESTRIAFGSVLLWGTVLFFVPLLGDRLSGVIHWKDLVATTLAFGGASALALLNVLPSGFAERGGRVREQNGEARWPVRGALSCLGWAGALLLVEPGVSEVAATVSAADLLYFLGLFGCIIHCGAYSVRLLLGYGTSTTLATTALVLSMTGMAFLLNGKDSVVSDGMAERVPALRGEIARALATMGFALTCYTAGRKIWWQLRDGDDDDRRTRPPAGL